MFYFPHWSHWFAIFSPGYSTLWFGNSLLLPYDSGFHSHMIMVFIILQVIQLLHSSLLFSMPYNVLLKCKNGLGRRSSKSKSKIKVTGVGEMWGQGNGSHFYVSVSAFLLVFSQESWHHQYFSSSVSLVTQGNMAKDGWKRVFSGP